MQLRPRFYQPPLPPPQETGNQFDRVETEDPSSGRTSLVELSAARLAFLTFTTRAIRHSSSSIIRERALSRGRPIRKPCPPRRKTQAGLQTCRISSQYKAEAKRAS